MPQKQSLEPRLIIRVCVASYMPNAFNKRLPACVCVCVCEWGCVYVSFRIVPDFFLFFLFLCCSIPRNGGSQYAFSCPVSTNDKKGKGCVCVCARAHAQGFCLIIFIFISIAVQPLRNGGPQYACSGLVSTNNTKTMVCVCLCVSQRWDTRAIQGRGRIFQA